MLSSLELDNLNTDDIVRTVELYEQIKNNIILEYLEDVKMRMIRDTTWLNNRKGIFVVGKLIEERKNRNT